MTKQTYAQIRKQIAALDEQANAVRNEERAGVVGRIKEAIKVYSLTAQDLFGNSKTSKAGKVDGVRAKYSDGTGNEWGGRGPRPQWLREALEAGRKLEDFALGGAASRTGMGQSPSSRSARKTAGRRGTAINRRKSIGVPKYRDPASGKTWTGQGKPPNWIKDVSDRTPYLIEGDAGK